jgi:hypothetical protein
MEITRQNQDTDSERWLDWHILTVAEAGFSMLDTYGRHKHGVDIETIKSFADQINDRDESGSLYPKAPISAIPRRFFRDIQEDDIPNHLTDFQNHINEFLVANRANIHARKILIDFHVSSAPVPELYITATEEVFRNNAKETEFNEIVIFTQKHVR